MGPIEGKADQPTSDVALADCLNRLVVTYCPESIYLFGSKARGDEGPDSDYDLPVIVPDDAPVNRTRGQLACEVLWGTGVAAVVVVWTRSQFERRRHVVASLPASVLREGKLL